MPLFILIILLPVYSFAFLDFVGEQAKKAMEAAAYIDAVSDLTSELTPNKDLEEATKNLNERTKQLRRNSSELRYFSSSSKSILNGPDWSSKRLDANIRNTTSYMKRLKKFAAKALVLGVEGSTAINTAETNVALTEIQKNQQAILIQNEDTKLRMLEKENEEAIQWQEFILRQRKIRELEKENGKLK